MHNYDIYTYNIMEYIDAGSPLNCWNKRVNILFTQVLPTAPVTVLVTRRAFLKKGLLQLLQLHQRYSHND